MQIIGLGGFMQASAIVDFEIKSSIGNEAKEYINAYVVKKISNGMPHQEIDIEKWPHIKRLKLADKGFHIPSDIDMLLGAEFYSKIVKSGLIKRNKAPTAQNTTFGWIMFGFSGDTTTRCVVSIAAVDADQILESMQRLWQLEQVKQIKHRTAEE